MTRRFFIAKGVESRNSVKMGELNQYFSAYFLDHVKRIWYLSPMQAAKVQASLARTFTARSYKQWVKRNPQTESQIPGPSAWLGMRS